MVNALDPGVSGPGSSPGWGHCVVFLGKTLKLSQCLSPPRCINGYRQLAIELLGKPDKLRGSDLRGTSIPSRGSRNTSSRFML